MSGRFDLEREELLKEINLLKLENKKINRQLALADRTMEKLKNTTLAQENLSAVIAADKSKQEKYLQVIVDNSPDIIMLLDSSTKFILSTQSFLKRTRIPNIGFLHNKTFKQVFSSFSGDAWLEHMENIFIKALSANEIQVTDEKIAIGGSGDERNYVVSVIPFTYGHASDDGILVIFNDLTDIVRAMDQAKASNAAKSNFLATMSHEIRTPMNAIIGMANMLEKTELNEHQMFISQNIKNSSMALLALVNDILDFSKIEAGKFELVEEYFDILSMIKNLKSVFEILFAQKNLVFNVNLAPNIPNVILGDENRLKQVITNLLSNTLKYTQEGHVALNVSCPDEETIRFDVEDTGIGIKKEDLEKLFTPFEQLDKITNKNVVGTGLGLAITRKICKVMNGGVDVRSTYGKGSVFSITLPAVRGNVSDLKKGELEFVKFTAPNVHALVVDDIDINLVVAEAMLEEYDMKITLAPSGYKAIELARENEFDIIFMDHMMPEMDGIETTLELRNLGGYLENIPIIALTANATVEAQNMFTQNGLNGFVAKPIDSMLLNNCLYKWLAEDKITLTDAPG